MMLVNCKSRVDRYEVEIDTDKERYRVKRIEGKSQAYIPEKRISVGRCAETFEPLSPFVTLSVKGG